MPPQRFVLSWQPTVADYEIAERAKRRATRVAWVDCAIGVAMMLLSLPRASQGDVISIFLVMLGASALTGWYHRVYRSLFVYRRRPEAFLPTRITLTSDGQYETDGQTDTRKDWSYWKAILHLDDRLVLMSAVGGNCYLLPLPKAALVEGGEWSELVQLVNEHVPDHPRDPHPRKASHEQRTRPTR